MKPAAHDVTNSMNQRGKFQSRSARTYGIAEPDAAHIRMSVNTIRFTVEANSLRLKSVSIFISLFGHVMSVFSFNAHT